MICLTFVCAVVVILAVTAFGVKVGLACMDAVVAPHQEPSAAFEEESLADTAILSSAWSGEEAAWIAKEKQGLYGRGGEFRREDFPALYDAIANNPPMDLVDFKLPDLRGVFPMVKGEE